MIWLIAILAVAAVIGALLAACCANSSAMSREEPSEPGDEGFVNRMPEKCKRCGHAYSCHDMLISKGHSFDTTGCRACPANRTCTEFVPSGIKVTVEELVKSL